MAIDVKGAGAQPSLSSAFSEYNSLKRAGAIREAYNYASAPVVSTLAALATGSEYSVGIQMFKGEVVTSITFASGTTAWSGSGTVDRYFVLRDSAGALLANSADDGANAWAANALKTLAMGTPYTVPATGLYYIGISHSFSAGASNTFFGNVTTLNAALAVTLTPLRAALTAGAITAGVPTNPITYGTTVLFPWAYFS